MESLRVSNGPRFVRKRDNVTTQNFDIRKIEKAIRSAWEAVHAGSADHNAIGKVIGYVCIKLIEQEVTTVAQIEAEVGYALMDVDKQVAEAYISYRDRQAARRASRKTPDIKALSNYIHSAKYARYIPELQRREVFEETVDRVRVMHLKRFPGVKEEINWAFDRVMDMEAFPSMRAMQFAGPAIEKVNCRQYNCSYTLMDRTEAFPETLYLLLCGCGVGYSVQKEHVAKLPKISAVNKGDVRHHRIDDSIEGWADALHVLIKSHLDGYYVEFNYSDIRPAGSLLRTSGGRAPGHLELKNSLERIRTILTNAADRQLTPIEVHDINCHSADAVLSGGIRRSAMIALFSIDDDAMMNCKASRDWHQTHGWRANANNSVAVIRGEIKKEDFQRIFEATKTWGEPGIVFLSNRNHGLNPCQPGWATVLTPDGIRTFDDISIGSTIWSGKQWTKVTNKVMTGTKPVFGYHTRAGVFYGTENHRIISNGERVEAKDAETIDCSVGGTEGIGSLDIQTVMDGLVIGDGMVHKASNNAVWLNIGKDDSEYFISEVTSLLVKSREAASPYAWEIKTTLSCQEVPLTYMRSIPDRFRFGGETVVRSFLRGLYSANGSICGGRVTLKATSRRVIEDAQMMLSSIGIASYYTVNKEHDVEFDNGTYTCRESYDLNVTHGRHKFNKLIGFIQSDKQTRLSNVCSKISSSGRNKTSYEIVEIQPMGDHNVYDITVEAEEHTYWTAGMLVSNCAEIGLDPVLEVTEDNINRLTTRGENVKIGDEVTGFAFCNLTEINASKFKSLEDFERAAKAATIIGTIQAAYTDFAYLGAVSEEIAQRDALLGVSMTGMMDAPDIACNPEYQQHVANKVVAWNREMAAKIGINPAARTTCVKPAGTSSLAWGGVASGHHLHHARRYFRRVTANHLEPVFKYFKMFNEHMCVRKPNGDYVIEFVVEAPLNALIKHDLTAVQFLEKVKSTQSNWVIPGTSRPEISPGLKHNVSNTVQVKDNEWDDVADYLYDNQEYFTGVSLLSDLADKQYQYAPNEAVTTEADEVRWNQIIELQQPVDYQLMIELEDGTTLKGEQACAGGACNII